MNQRGSAMVLGLIAMLFLIVLLSGLVPLVSTALKSTSVDRDIIEAQFVAEAGAKRAVVGIINNRTDWAWALNNSINPIIDGSSATKYYVITSISPAINDGATPASGTTYTITSKGTVNGVSKTVKTVVKPSASSLFQNVFYSGHDMRIVSGNVTGNIASDGLITVGYGMTVNGNVIYSASTPVINGSAGTVTQVSDKIGSINVASLMQYTPTMPSFTKPNTALPYANTALSGGYYCSSDFTNWNYYYTVAADKSVFIYVNGDYTIGTPITGGGNITIYATGNITVNGNIVGNNVQIYAGKNITLSQNTITGNNITLQSAGDFYISGGSVTANTKGTINIYSGGKIDAGSGAVTGSIVTMIAKSLSTDDTITSGGLHGVTINSGQSTYVTKIYCNGDVNLASGSIGGVSMIVSNGSINLHGITSSATLIADGNIEAQSGSSGGLYANGSIYIHGATVNYANSSMTSLGLTSGSTTYQVSWSK